MKYIDPRPIIASVRTCFHGFILYFYRPWDALALSRLDRRAKGSFSESLLLAATVSNAFMPWLPFQAGPLSVATSVIPQFSGFTTPSLLVALILVATNYVVRLLFLRVARALLPNYSRQVWVSAFNVSLAFVYAMHFLHFILRSFVITPLFSVLHLTYVLNVLQPRALYLFDSIIGPLLLLLSVICPLLAIFAFTRRPPQPAKRRSAITTFLLDQLFRIAITIASFVTIIVRTHSIEEKYPVSLLRRTGTEPIERVNKDLEDLIRAPTLIDGKEYIPASKMRAAINQPVILNLQVSFLNGSDTPLILEPATLATLELRTYDMVTYWDFTKYFLDFYFATGLTQPSKTSDIVLRSGIENPLSIQANESQILELKGQMKYIDYLETYLNTSKGQHTDRVLVLSFIDAKSGEPLIRKIWLNLNAFDQLKRRTAHNNMYFTLYAIFPPGFLFGWSQVSRRWIPLCTFS